MERFAQLPGWDSIIPKLLTMGLVYISKAPKKSYLLLWIEHMEKQNEARIQKKDRPEERIRSNGAGDDCPLV